MVLLVVVLCCVGVVLTYFIIRSYRIQKELAMNLEHKRNSTMNVGIGKDQLPPLPPINPKMPVHTTSNSITLHSFQSKIASPMTVNNVSSISPVPIQPNFDEGAFDDEHDLSVIKDNAHNHGPRGRLQRAPSQTKTFRKRNFSTADPQNTDKAINIMINDGNNANDTDATVPRLRANSNSSSSNTTIDSPFSPTESLDLDENDHMQPITDPKFLTVLSQSQDVDDIEISRSHPNANLHPIPKPPMSDLSSIPQPIPVSLPQAQPLNVHNLSPQQSYYQSPITSPVQVQSQWSNNQHVQMWQQQQQQMQNNYNRNCNISQYQQPAAHPQYYQNQQYRQPQNAMMSPTLHASAHNLVVNVSQPPTKPLPVLPQQEQVPPQHAVPLQRLTDLPSGPDLPRESLLTPPDHTPISTSTELTNMTDTARTTYPVESGADEEEDLDEGTGSDTDSNTSSSSTNSSSSTDHDNKDSDNDEEDTELKKQEFEESENIDNVTRGRNGSNIKGHYNKTSSMKTTRIILPRESDISVPRDHYYDGTMIINKRGNENRQHYVDQSSLWTVTTPLTADSMDPSHPNFKSVTQITPDPGMMGGVYGDMFGIKINDLNSSDDDIEETEEAPLSPNV